MGRERGSGRRDQSVLAEHRGAQLRSLGASLGVFWLLELFRLGPLSISFSFLSSSLSLCSSLIERDSSSVLF